MNSHIRTIRNMDDNTEKVLFSDAEFLNYARSVYKENEEGNPYPSEIHWMPENIQQAAEYIHEYCYNLELID